MHYNSVAFIFSRVSGLSNRKRDFLLFPHTSFSVFMKSSNKTADCWNPRQTSLYRNVGQKRANTYTPKNKLLKYQNIKLYWSNCVEDENFIVSKFTWPCYLRSILNLYLYIGYADNKFGDKISKQTYYVKTEFCNIDLVLVLRHLGSNPKLHFDISCPNTKYGVNMSYQTQV